MKKNFTFYFAVSFLLSAFCFLPHSSAFAQNSFPTSNAIWNESIYVNERKYEKLFGLLGDTLINEKLYRRLYELSDTILSEKYIAGYIGAFRNEEKKVFFRPAYWELKEAPDILLYDFGAEVGDTIWHNAIINSYGNGGYDDIQPYDKTGSIILSTTIDENNRKVYTCSGFGMQCYEGMGSIVGVLRSIPTFEPTDGNTYGYKLDCFKDNDTVKYVNSSCNKCFCRWVIGIPDNNLDNNYINIFPNPTNYELRITNYELQITNYELQITDITGKIVFTQKLQKETEYNIDISHLQSGIYFLKIDNQTFKIIKN